MKKVLLFLTLCGLTCSMNAKTLHYPQAAVTNQVDEFYGEQVADPYRWMEDNNAPEVKEWVEAENALTFSYLAKIPQREKIKQRLEHLWNYERYGIPSECGGHYFISRNNGLQNQSVFYVMDSLDGEMRVLLDPNTLSEDGTVALSGISISEDGKWMAYGLSCAGSDWQEWRVKNVETGEDTADHIQWIKFSGAEWRKDGSGFYYCGYDKPDDKTLYQDANCNQKIYFHKLGDSQDKDTVIYQRPDVPQMNFVVCVTDDDHYLVISEHQGTAPREEIYLYDLSVDVAADKKIQCILPGFDADYRYVANEGNNFYFFTDNATPMGSLVLVDITKPQKENWKTIISESREALIGVTLINNQFVAQYIKNASSLVKIYNLDGSFVREVQLPGIGTVSGFWGKKKDKETFYSFLSYTMPSTIYRYNMETGESSVFKKPAIEFDPSLYETVQVFYHSKDGTPIPMFITSKKGIKHNGKNPTLLYGYGGFNVSMQPRFYVSTLVWLEMGGVYAVANIRGGGEYGEGWHQMGIKLNKQNVFDDFIAAAEWLIDEKITSPNKLAIQGGSNGGLLVGACMTQRPDLYGVALPAVGVMDMLRYHKFTIGWAWADDYGTVDNEAEYHVLRAYSPLHNIKEGTRYPATLVTTGDHDDRVVPAHSFKFGAELQAKQAGKAPVLIRIETSAGHGMGKPVSKVIEENADVLAFTVKNLKMKPKGY